MRAIGYVRISKADKDKTDAEQRLSMRAQAEQIRTTCEAKGWELVGIHEDFALSGNDDTRPGTSPTPANKSSRSPPGWAWAADVVNAWDRLQALHPA